MSWAEYYQETPISFKKQAPLYSEALTAIGERNPQVMDRESEQKVLLGGFHPRNGTPEQFTIFCLGQFNRAQLIFLDKNSEPFTNFVSTPNRIPIQLALEDIDLLPPSLKPIDLIILDFTLTYMDDSSIRKFANHAPYVLSRNGIILATTTSPALQGIWEDLLDNGGRKPTTYHQEYFRTLEEVKKLTCPPLKTIYIKESYFGQEDLVALSRLDSSFTPSTAQGE